MKIAIAGYGVEGQSNYHYWRQMPMADITIVDEADQPAFAVPGGVKTLFGAGSFAKLDGFDLVIRSAGIAPRKITTDGKVWSATNEFFLQCANQQSGRGAIDIIGVTGSKGKGTTASLIASILRAAGRKVWLVGNIGLPALDIIDQIEAGDIVVYELSSFQLWDIERSPQTAVVLFIEQEHLDVHTDMADYVGAKANITKYQTADNLAVYNQENDYSRSIGEQSIGQKVPFPSQMTTHITDGAFYNGEHFICSVNELMIPGVHNEINAVAAIDAVWKYTTDPVAIAAGLRDFKGLPHRLSFVAEVKGVKYYDDSIATTPGSAIAALRAFAGRKILILGGSSKKSDYNELATELTKHDVKVLLIGQVASEIAAVCEAAGFTSFEILENPTMSKIVACAHSIAEPGDTVLLSPAAASFGLFKNYVDRGQQFIDAVSQLSQ
jgi:UDP-N-acetylmuramoylalanine--D-glutamate ligase